jgi:hypothetical protein
MAKSTRSGHASHAHKIAKKGENVRDKVRDLTVRALRERDVGARDLSRVVDDVWEGAKRGVHESVPQSQKNVLRQVLDGLGEAADAAVKAGAGVVRDARSRGETIAKKDAATAAKQVREAHGKFLDAAGTLARRLKGEARDEVADLVSRVRKAAPKVRSAAGDAVSSADGRLLELGGETVRAGSKIARKAIGGLMMATGGLLEGMAESIAPERSGRSTPAAPRKSRPKPKKRAGALKKRRASKRKKARKARR